MAGETGSSGPEEGGEERGEPFSLEPTGRVFEEEKGGFASRICLLFIPRPLEILGARCNFLIYFRLNLAINLNKGLKKAIDGSFFKRQVPSTEIS